MNKLMISLLSVVALAVLTVAGCDVNAGRQKGAQVRFDQTMYQVRMDTARQSLAEGRYAYARKVLEPCLDSPHNHQEAERLMARIQAEDRAYAQLNAYRSADGDSERVY